MSFASEHRERIELAACFLAPIVAGGVIALATAPAAPEADPPRTIEETSEESSPVQVVSRPVLSGAELEAYDAEVARTLGAGEIATVFPVRDERVAEVERVDEPEAMEEPERPEFTLSSVMSGRNGAMCVINQQVRRVGEEAAPGWRVALIDAESRSVTLEGPEGETLTLTQGL